MTAHVRHLHAVSDRDVQLAERVAAQLARLLADEHYADQVADWHAPIVVGCSTCDAWAGLGCRTPGNWPVRNGFHAPRIKSVAGWSREKKLTAYAQIKAEEEQRRADEDARQDALEADPAYVAQRDAARAQWKAAFDRLNADFRAEERRMYARCRSPWIHRDGCTCRTDPKENP